MDSELDWALELDKDRLFNLLNRGTAEQKAQLYHQCIRFKDQNKKEEKEKETQQVQRRWSLSEFENNIAEKLTDNHIKQILKKARCIKLYRLLYGNATSIDVTQNESADDDGDDGLLKDGYENRSTDANISSEKYLEIFIAILAKINTSDSNPDRLKFSTFLDSCWLSLEFDQNSFGNIDQVYDQPSCKNTNDYSILHLMKPYRLRLYCLNHIKAFFLKEMDLESIYETIDATTREIIDGHFSGKYHFYFQVHLSFFK